MDEVREVPDDHPIRVAFMAEELTVHEFAALVEGVASGFDTDNWTVENMRDIAERKPWRLDG